MVRQGAFGRAHGAAAASGGGAAQPAAPVVAQRLCDILLAFPAAAAGGVQWQVLVKKYEDRHASRLDLGLLGYDTPLAAATTLLWEVVRIIDSEDVDNPVVGIEDSSALQPQPGLLGSWPSLYVALVKIVRSHGGALRDREPARECGDSGAASGLLLSQLKAHLEQHWHANFEESGLGFMNEEGTFIRLKKMKHLVHAVLRWRDQRQAWRQSEHVKPTAIDEALLERLELVASSRHNDLVLRFATEDAAGATPSLHRVPAERPRAEARPDQAEAAASAAPREPEAAQATQPADVSGMAQELAQLRSENAHLRRFHQHICADGPMVLGTPLGCAPLIGAPGMSTPMSKDTPATPQIEPDMFDDPFEPPPEARSWKHQEWRHQEPFWLSRTCSTAFSTTDGSDFGNDASSCGTPAAALAARFDLLSSTASGATSGAMTPMTPAHQQTVAAGFMPVWFPMMPSSLAFGGLVDVSVIPSGIVRSVRAQFEPGLQSGA